MILAYSSTTKLPEVYIGLVDFCSVCELRSRQLKALTRECMMPPQKYTSSQHGNKCLKEEIRSVTKVVFVGKDKAGLVRKDTT